MGQRSRRAGGYRGRRTFHDRLLSLTIILGVIVVLAVGGLFFAQRYIVYTDNGLRIELPFLQGLRPDQSGDVNLIDGDTMGSQSVPGLPEPEPEPEEPALAALQVSLTELLEGTAPQKLAEAGANALVVVMKDQEGQLGWASQLEEASQSFVSSEVAGINNHLRLCNQGETYTIARVACFRDNSVPYYFRPYGIQTSNGWNWRDDENLRWMSPAVPEVRAYVAGLCAELAELGFDEIVLEDCCFPNRGGVDVITRGNRYDPARLSESMEAFFQELRSALKPYDTALSVRVDPAVLTGEDTRTGLTPALLETYADHIWMEDDPEQPAADLLFQAGITEGDSCLVLISNALPQGAQAAYALLTE
ncbi:MAG: hypothetical protein HFF50_05640 [Lawsonibacter sp.]|nr:hypothetical protein [Lawsonibacter sp.]